MQKVHSLFARDVLGVLADTLVTSGRWVLNEPAKATVQWDGAPHLVWDGVLYRSYTRKDEHKAAPDGWVPWDTLELTLVWDSSNAVGRGWAPIKPKRNQDKPGCRSTLRSTNSRRSGLRVDGSSPRPESRGDRP